jgi:hypothetical protein
MVTTRYGAWHGGCPGSGRPAGGVGDRGQSWCRPGDRDRARACWLGRVRDRLDLLVNNAWGGYERLNAGAWEEWNALLWQQPVELFDAMFTGSVRTHYVTLAQCAPLLISTAASPALSPPRE